MTILRIWKVICSNVTLEILFYMHLMQTAMCMLWPRGAFWVVDGIVLFEGLLGFPLVFSFPSLAFKLLIFISSSSLFLSLAVLTLHFSFIFFFLFFFFFLVPSVFLGFIFGALCIFWALDCNLETISFYFTVIYIYIYIYISCVCLS